METIKNYLDAMFAAMPNTAEVRKAKAELLQMMEDKYNELISEGQSENNAVGTVISEFGNLDELADDLGVKQELVEVQEREAQSPRRTVTLDESKDFISNRMRKAKYLAAGIMLCIISVAAPIFFGSKGHGALGATFMFLLIALGVGGIVYSGLISSSYRFLKT
ncbi:MAG: permease prefix domain 1-containing protein, partial [Lachnospiraceae bacterium]|nr:permease prefix domain 1-containing protein [Lachnospiraceae bacterium]